MALGGPAAGSQKWPGVVRVVVDLVALTKPRLSVLVLLTTTGGLWLAPGRLGQFETLITVLGATLVVSGANALNCYLERDSDGLMTRTRDRPLPAGRLHPSLALAFGLASGALAIGLLLWFVNLVTGVLALLGYVAYVWIYTPLKQRSAIAMVVGAIPGAVPPLLGWTAVTATLDTAGLALFGILFFWQLPHFLAIAVEQQSEYSRGGVQTLPERHGIRLTKWLSVLATSALLVTSLAVAPLIGAGPMYGATAAVIGVAFLIRTTIGFWADDDRAWARGVFRFSLVYLSVLFAALVADGLWRG